jgi:tetratricopeptide (TPR) repeat protein
VAADAGGAGQAGDDRRAVLEEGRRYESGGVLDRALEHYRVAARSASAAVAAEALRRQADVLRTGCDWDGAVVAAHASAAVARGAGLAELEADAINAEAAVYQMRGDLAAAGTLYERMLELSGDPRVRGIALQNLGTIAAEKGALAEAEARFLESHRWFEAAGYARGSTIALNNSGRCLIDQAQSARAEPILEQALAGAQLIGDLDLVALVRLNLGEALLHRGALDHAEQMASAAFGYFGTTANRWRQTECLRLLGDIALRRGRQDEAESLYRAGLRHAAALGASLEQARLQSCLDALASTPTSDCVKGSIELEFPARTNGGHGDR